MTKKIIKNQNISLKISSTILNIAAVAANSLRKKNILSHIMQVATAEIQTNVTESTAAQSTITVNNIVKIQQTSITTKPNQNRSS